MLAKSVCWQSCLITKNEEPVVTIQCFVRGHLSCWLLDVCPFLQDSPRLGCNPGVESELYRIG